ncbi:hypothetical protein [Actinomadura sp. 7K534]|uniref:hypothetical protein n=1 Tax=Actinomadura sp. 7K534 TaxID=2530366 RepID=UPI0014055FEA|nr:hypothetical protein [Actinomadura sp. 7K534]
MSAWRSDAIGIVARGASNGPIRATVSAWPALALVGNFELLMPLLRNAERGDLCQGE